MAQLKIWKCIYCRLAPSLCINIQVKFELETYRSSLYHRHCGVTEIVCLFVSRITQILLVRAS